MTFCLHLLAALTSADAQISTAQSSGKRSSREGKTIYIRKDRKNDEKWEVAKVQG
jgi:hypothetical protein